MAVSMGVELCKTYLVYHLEKSSEKFTQAMVGDIQEWIDKVDAAEERGTLGEDEVSLQEAYNREWDRA